jgi:hypothetical protein
MTDYTKELEAHIESLKQALDKERDWVDYMNKRKKSQKYRRWGVRFMMKSRNVPDTILKDIPLEHCYAEYVQTTLEDLRSMIRYNFDNSIESYYGNEIPRIHRSVMRKGGNPPVITFFITIYLFNQVKDKEVFTKVVSFDMGFYGNTHGVRVSNVTGLEPRQVREIDEYILPILMEGDEYLNKWEKLHPED